MFVDEDGEEIPRAEMEEILAELSREMMSAPSPENGQELHDVIAAMAVEDACWLACEVTRNTFLGFLAGGRSALHAAMEMLDGAEPWEEPAKAWLTRCIADLDESVAGGQRAAARKKTSPLN